MVLPQLAGQTKRVQPHIKTRRIDISKRVSISPTSGSRTYPDRDQMISSGLHPSFRPLGVPDVEGLRLQNGLVAAVIVDFIAGGVNNRLACYRELAITTTVTALRFKDAHFVIIKVLVLPTHFSRCASTLLEASVAAVVTVSVLAVLGSRRVAS